MVFLFSCTGEISQLTLKLVASKQKGAKQDIVSFFTSKTKKTTPVFYLVTPKSAPINSCELNNREFMTSVTFSSAPLCLPSSASDPIVFDFPLNSFTGFWKITGEERK